MGHAYLSFGNADILAGNMISDFVKGRAQFAYPQKIQTGIRLHRTIDFLTDNHPATQKTKEIFKPAYRLYAGAFTDVVYDYFLANDETVFRKPADLLFFSENTYRLLETKKEFFPDRFAGMFPYMKSQNWLYNYRLETGIQSSFEGLRRRSKYISETQTAFRLFLENENRIRESFRSFFPDVKNAADLFLRAEDIAF